MKGELLVYQSCIPGISTMALTNINSNWMSNASSGLCINLCYLYYVIMAYGSTPYVGMTPKKNGGHIKSDTLEMSALD